MRKNKDYDLILFSLLFTFSILIKILLIILYPGKLGSDQLEYLNIANNIISGCGISHSNLQIEECVLSAGGARGPGYPIFLSILLFIYDETYFHLRLFNAIFISFSVLFLIYCLRNVFYSYKIFILSSIFLVLSPFTNGWPRSILTESISISFTVIFFALLVRLILTKKCNNSNILIIGIVLCLASFVRIELIFLNIIFVIYLFYQFKTYFFIKKLILFTVIFSLPWSLWTVRNIYHDIQILPQHAGYDLFRNSNTEVKFYNQKSVPDGYYRWVGAWVKNEYQRAGAIFPIGSKNYNAIFIDFNQISKNKKLNNDSKKLIEQLKEYNGKSIPRKLDNKFNLLADQIISDDRLNFYVFLPLKRNFNQIFTITNSNGLPIEFDNLTYEERNLIIKGDLDSIIIFFKSNFIKVSLKIVSNSWKVILVLSLIIVTILNFFTYKNKSDYEKQTIYYKLFFYTFLYFLIKSVFTGYTIFIEPRFFINIMPILEVLFFLMIDRYYFKKKI